jgi:adenylate cyclase
MQLRGSVNGVEQVYPLTGDEVRIGRGSENEVVLTDFSVSRRHAVLRREGGGWQVEDLGSTNGVQVNAVPLKKSPIKVGDTLKVGIFELKVEGGEAAVKPQATAVPAPAPAAKADGDKKKTPSFASGTIIRSLADFNADYGLAPAPSGTGSFGTETVMRMSKRKQLDEAYGSKVFGFLTRLARLLMTSDQVGEVLERVMDIAFEALPVHRGFIVLRDEKSGETRCVLARSKGKTERDPKGEVPVSKTMLDTVMTDRVALLTYDAQSDQRLAGGESIRIHQIRAAMCAPLWSGERIIGVIQVDSPFHAGTFTENDLDLLTALANYAAVAVDRIRYAESAANERQMRSRLERYHSPAVIEEVMKGDGSAASGVRRLRQSEASVLFGDLVGFTTMSESSDPDLVAEILEGYFTHSVEAIFGAGGTLDKFIGDCVMAFFGAPVEQSDHAVRAVRAAVDIQKALRAWNAERKAEGLSEVIARIGINSGPVVVGDIGSKKRVDYTVLGTTVNVASRLESVAPPHGIVIGDRTFQLLQGAIPTQPLGQLSLKGLQQKITAYKVLFDE